MKPYRDLVFDLLQVLNKSDLEYVVLRNFDKIPDDVGNDLDILINDLDEAKDLLIKMCLKHDWKIIQTIKGYNFRGYILANKDKCELQVDFFQGMFKKWVAYYDSKLMLQNKIYQDTFYRPSDLDCLLSVVLKELLTYGYVREKYHNYCDTMVIQLRNNKAEMVSQLNKIFKMKNSEKLIDFIFQKKCRGKFKINRPLNFFFNVKELLTWLYYRIIFMRTK